MRPYEDLTYLGRVRRLRKLASVALDAYGLAGARLKFVRDAGNTMFRVYASDLAPAKAATDLYEEGQYLLRIHQPGYQTTDAIELELSWLTGMCRDANLPVPEPVPTLDGKLLTQVSISGIPEERNCSLLRWLKGRFLTNEIGPRHYKAQGRLMARLHDYAAQWQPPPDLAKRHWDWNGLFEEVEGTDLMASEIWPLVPRKYVESLRVVTRRARQVMEEWGTSPDVYGLIHADLGLDANVLFWRGEARAIDFDDSGFGYWMYDLAVSLEHCREDKEFSLFRDALLGGYAELRPLPEEQLEHLGLFLAAWDVYLSLWAAGMANLYRRHRDELYGRLERAAEHVACYVAGI